MELQVSTTGLENPRPVEAPGIGVELLLKSVKNTAPFIFEPTEDFEYIRILRDAEMYREVSLSRYFLLCIAGHFVTVAAFVPTDLDQTIRLKLWKIATHEQVEEMIVGVEKFLTWDDRLVSGRQVNSPDGHYITGHYGEWFTIAVAAFYAAKKFGLSDEVSLREKILDLVRQHERAISNLIETQSWLDLYTASALVAHNFGDLDRAFDLWNIANDDPLKTEVYKLGHSPRGSFRSLYIAGEINKKYTAAESHRHFVLRKPRVLRRFSDLLIGMGPFYDNWGARVAKHPGLELDEVTEITEALIDGWEKLNRVQPVYGYARALHGILGQSRGVKALDSLPSSRKKLLRTGSLAQMIAVPTGNFEASWAGRLQKFIRDLG